MDASTAPGAEPQPSAPATAGPVWPPANAAPPPSSTAPPPSYTAPPPSSTAPPPSYTAPPPSNTAPPPFNAAPSDAVEVAETETPPAGLWQQMKADPQYAPEHLTLEAVRRLGPQARSWVERTRVQYPGIDPDTVAQIATRRFTTFARMSGAAAGATGLPGAVLDVGVLAWTQARMVLHIAAAYGVDPTHPDRATDLLVLQKVHKYAETARTALAVAAGNEQAGALFAKASQAPMTAILGQLTWKLAQMAGMKAAKKMLAKIIPGAAIIFGTWANSSATQDLAKRTVALYRRPPSG